MRERERERERDYDNRREERGGEGEGGTRGEKEGAAPPPAPDYGLSGILAAETNTQANGSVAVYTEPDEAALPSMSDAGARWRLYVFKGGEPLRSVTAKGMDAGVAPPLHVYMQSKYLIGRNREQVDIPVDHPSCSMHHAVLQYRLVEDRDADADGLGLETPRVVRPYLMDIGSTNGTFLNGDKIEAQRYYELREKVRCCVECTTFSLSLCTCEYSVLCM